MKFETYDSLYFSAAGKRIQVDENLATGTVLEANQNLCEIPGILKNDPFGEGWIIKIEMEQESDLALLKRSADYKQYLTYKALNQNLVSGVQVFESGPQDV
jgi:glycine cleavage system H lipoate-binding protein